MNLRNKNILSTFISISVLLLFPDSAFCQDKPVLQGEEYARHVKAKPFIKDEMIPDGSVILPSPPEVGTEEFANDLYYYNWGKEQRLDSLRADQASFDCFNKDFDDIGDCFDKIFGVDINVDNTPELCELLKRTMVSIRVSFSKAKDEYKRVRPYDEFNEPSLIEERGEQDIYRGSYSYPSGHTLRAFTTAYLLSEINPEAASELVRRARIYAENRVICGHHYKSDTDASIMVAGALVAVLHTSDEFIKQMEKAKAEYRRKSKISK